MNNRQTIFNLIHEATDVSLAPCDMDEIIRLARAEIKEIVDETPNNYELGGKVRSYFTEGPVRESGEAPDDIPTDTESES